MCDSPDLALFKHAKIDPRGASVHEANGETINFSNNSVHMHIGNSRRGTDGGKPANRRRRDARGMAYETGLDPSSICAVEPCFGLKLHRATSERKVKNLE
jgi:hypothetical protein